MISEELISLGHKAGLGLPIGLSSSDKSLGESCALKTNKWA
jgi:hypothetical protein